MSTAGGAFLHRHVEHDGDTVVAVCELGSPDRLAIPLVATFATHQRFLRYPVVHGASPGLS